MPVMHLETPSETLPCHWVSVETCSMQSKTVGRFFSILYANMFHIGSGYCIVRSNSYIIVFIKHNFVFTIFNNSLFTLNGWALTRNQQLIWKQWKY